MPGAKRETFFTGKSTMHRMRVHDFGRGPKAGREGTVGNNAKKNTHGIELAQVSRGKCSSFSLRMQQISAKIQSCRFEYSQIHAAHSHSPPPQSSTLLLMFQRAFVVVLVWAQFR